ncbi:hypothetical protein GPECTOR_364g142 [Gonium pectorale]|uniref:Uncharacterized protein n=1 Tax=Gonium pectorale TaxID=33097 RepID=A0A150FVG4_GONPE|nr:hypothetical protein GPECTOR_364g142 [Gonium pectorale]|eukprot:KXZ41611.1 hypothetical protein GPECTOR_364g142 [Gonium pectorale]
MVGQAATLGGGSRANSRPSSPGPLRPAPPPAPPPVAPAGAPPATNVGLLRSRLSAVSEGSLLRRSLRPTASRISTLEAELAAEMSDDDEGEDYGSGSGKGGTTGGGGTSGSGGGGALDAALLPTEAAEADRPPAAARRSSMLRLSLPGNGLFLRTPELPSRVASAAASPLRRAKPQSGRGVSFSTASAGAAAAGGGGATNSLGVHEAAGGDGWRRRQQPPPCRRHVGVGAGTLESADIDVGAAAAAVDAAVVGSGRGARERRKAAPSTPDSDSLLDPVLDELDPERASLRRLRQSIASPNRQHSLRSRVFASLAVGTPAEPQDASSGRSSPDGSTGSTGSTGGAGGAHSRLAALANQAMKLPCVGLEALSDPEERQKVIKRLNNASAAGPNAFAQAMTVPKHLPGGRWHR